MTPEIVNFENQGFLDLEMIKTFGVSVKERENPIGYFGTGLKYAIAVLVRNEIPVELHIGNNKHIFGRRRVNMRGKDFDVVTMDGEQLPFTTELGKNWELWQAFRELWCNCKDEGGKISYADEFPKEGTVGTRFLVFGHEFAQLWRNRGEFILRKNNLQQVTTTFKDVEIYRHPSKAVFYRGIKVMEVNKPFLFTYNITSEIELTEDRTVKYSWSAEARIKNAIVRLEDSTAVRDIVNAPKSSVEAEFNFDNITQRWEVSDVFHETLAEEYAVNGRLMNDSARALFKRLSGKTVAALVEREEMTDVEKLQLERAMMICEKLYPDIRKYPVITTADLGSLKIGEADMSEKKIILSKKAFKMGTKMLVTTIIEEYMHITTGYFDLTRELQNHLFDTITDLIEKFVIQEPI